MASCVCERRIQMSLTSFQRSQTKATNYHGCLLCCPFTANSRKETKKQLTTWKESKHLNLKHGVCMCLL
jgi:hypothetical protein